MNKNSAPSGTQANITKLLISRMPQMPYVAHDPKKWGVKRRPLKEALSWRHVQVNRPYDVQALQFDVDHPEAAAFWIDAGLPQPHFIVVNPKNGHAKYVYVLDTPVVRADGRWKGKKQVWKWLLSIKAAMTKLLGADECYSGLIVNNPLHGDWSTIVHDAPAYTLSDLEQCIPPNMLRREPKKLVAHGEGRNTTLFDAARKWAYQQIGTMRHLMSQARWMEVVTEYAASLNTFPVRLTVNEVNAIGKSVANWVWGKAGQLRYAAIGGLKRDKIQSEDREEMSPEEARERMSENAQHVASVKRLKTQGRIQDALARLMFSRRKVNAKNLCKEALLSLATVYRHKGLWVALKAGNTDSILTENPRPLNTSATFALFAQPAPQNSCPEVAPPSPHELLQRLAAGFSPGAAEH